MRTKRFKNWFGDWEAAQVAQEVRSLSAQPLNLSGVSLEKKEAEARFAAFGEIENERYGVKATFPNNTAGKILRHKGFDVTQIIDSLPELFRTSVLALSEPEIPKEGHKPHNNIRAYHHFVNKFTVTGKDYYIRFTAYEENTRKPTNRRSIHSTTISAVDVYEDNKKASPRSLSGNNPGVAEQMPFIDTKIANLFDSVNGVSQVVDANGEPKVMFHGTPDGSFVAFRPGAYFSSEQQYADRYQNPSASSISTGKQAVNPKTFDVFLNIRKPFDLSDPEVRRIYIEEYVKGGNAFGINPYLSDEEYAKITDVDWTEGEDPKEFLQENGYDYDGIRLNEGGDPDGSGGVIDRGDSYLVFNPNQIKSTRNLGTFNESGNIYHQSAAPSNTVELNAATVRDAESRAYMREQMLARGMSEADADGLMALLDGIADKVLKLGKKNSSLAQRNEQQPLRVMDKVRGLVPVHLRVKNGVVTSVRLTSFYGKGEVETGTPRDEWFINEVVDEETGQLTGRLRYINTKKNIPMGRGP